MQGIPIKRICMHVRATHVRVGGMFIDDLELLATTTSRTSSQILNWAARGGGHSPLHIVESSVQQRSPSLRPLQSSPRRNPFASPRPPPPLPSPQLHPPVTLSVVSAMAERLHVSDPIASANSVPSSGAISPIESANSALTLLLQAGAHPTSAVKGMFGKPAKEKRTRNETGTGDHDPEAPSAPTQCDWFG